MNFLRLAIFTIKQIQYASVSHLSREQQARVHIRAMANSLFGIGGLELGVYVFILHS